MPLWPHEAEQNHLCERGRSTSVGDADALGRPRRSVLAFGGGGFTMTVGRVALLVGVALLVLVANVAASVLYMVIYGYVIDPGHEPKYYDDHIQVAGPYCIRGASWKTPSLPAE